MQENILENKPASGLSQTIEQTWLEKRLLHNGIQLQLFVTHALCAGCALAALFLFLQAGWHVSQMIMVVAVILLCGGLGLLLTANLQYCFARIESSLHAIIRGQTIRIPDFSWPCTSIFEGLQQLDRRVQTYIEGERAATEIRRNYLQRASDNATLTERQRIARDLHDSIKQQLFSISISAATARAYWEKDIERSSTAVADIQRVVKEAQVEMQALLQQLGSAPLENTRLADALRVQAEALKYRSELDIEINISEIPHPEVLPATAHETIFRLVQEAFSNIARHARAKSVVFTLRQTEKFLHLIIRDDGNGFDQDQVHAGMGLTNMRERVAAINGTIELRSAPEQGTVLHVSIPLLILQQPDENQIRMQQEVEQAIERGTRGYQAGKAAQNIALFLLVVSQFWTQIPSAAVAVSWLVACYGLPTVYFWKRKLSQLRSMDDPDVLGLQQKEEKLWEFFLVILFMGESIIFIRGDFTQFLALLAMQFLFGLSIVLVVWHQWRRYRTRARVYLTMEPVDIQSELLDQRRRVRATLSLLFVLVTALLFAQGRPFWQVDLTSSDRWNLVVQAIMVVCLLCIAVSQFIILRQKHMVLKRKLQQTVYKGELHDR